MKQPISFLCCIEPGRLEQQTCLMATTLRQFGGPVAKHAPIYAVRGRSGGKLSQETQDCLAALNVELVDAGKYNPFPWFNFANKIAAVTWGQEQASSKYLAWLDSDILIAGNFLCDLPEDFDIAGRCDTTAPVLLEGNRKYENYWRKLCQLAHADYEAIPWVTNEYGKRQKLYVNSGFFIWRRASSFAGHYRQLFIDLIGSRLATPDNAAWFADQVIISPVIAHLAAKFHHLPMENHHMMFQFRLDGDEPSPSMHRSTLIHYSKSLNEPHRHTMLARLQTELPHLAELVANFASPTNERIGFRHATVRRYRQAVQKLFSLRTVPVI